MTVPAWSGPLGDALALVIDHRGKTPKKLGGDWTESGVPVLSAMHVKGGRVDAAEARCISEEMHERWMPERLCAGDVLLTSEAPLGEAAYLRHEIGACLGQRLYALRADEEVLHSRFLYFLLRDPTMQAKLAAHATGTTVLGIRQSALVKVEVDLPDVQYQRQVASVLGSYDDLIENNRRRIEILEEMAGLVYREWFVHFRFPGHEDVELVDSHLGRIPEGWYHLRLGELAEVMKGLSYKGAYLGDEGMPMANLKCVAPAGGFRRDGVKPYNGPYKDRQSVEPGDIVVANTDLTQAGNVIGSATQLPAAVFGSGGLLSHHLFRVRLKDGVPIGRGYLLSTLHDIRFREWVRGCASGTTVLGLRREDAEQYPTLVPSRQVASRFEDAVQPLRELADVLEDQCEVLAEARNLLLPRLISGELDVSDVDLDLEPVA